MRQLYGIAAFVYIVFCLATFFCMGSNVHAAILEPSGGETGEFWTQNQTHTIKWDTSSFHGTLTISLWNHATTSYSVISTNANASAGEFSWTIPSNHATGDNFRMRIAENADPSHYEMSASFFPIYPIAPALVSSVGSEQETGGENLRVFPNPASDHVSLQWKKEGAEKLILRSITGSVVLSVDLKGRMEYNLSTANLGSGVYMLEVQFAQGFLLNGSVHIVR